MRPLLYSLLVTLFGGDLMANSADYPKTVEQIFGKDYMQNNLGLDPSNPANAYPFDFAFPEETEQGIERKIFSPFAVKGYGVSVYGELNFESTQEYLSHHGFVPIKVAGSSIGIMNFFDFTESGGGPYTEFQFAIAAAKAGEKTEFKSLDEYVEYMGHYQETANGLFYVQLALGGKNSWATEIAIRAGRRGIAFPKFWGESYINIEGNKITLSVDQKTTQVGAADPLGRSMQMEFSVEFPSDIEKLDEEKFDSYKKNDMAFTTTPFGDTCTTKTVGYWESSKEVSESFSFPEGEFTVTGDNSLGPILKKQLNFRPARAYYHRHAGAFMRGLRVEGNACGPKHALPYREANFTPKI